ncbi:MAG: MlaE family ABC transporter permease [Bacteroidia bacterium]
MIRSILYHIGRYFIMMWQVFSKPEKFAVYRKEFFHSIESLGVNSLPIVSIISFFMGAVITIQAAFGFTSPFVPLYAIGVSTRDAMILEFSPTIISLILAGKVGSNIASEIGTMRVSEQIDALEIMGVNSKAFLILPKVLACVVINPFLIMISMFLGILGGWILGVFTHVVTSYKFTYGIQYQFNSYNVTYSLIKTVVFAFIISSVAAYQGYYTEGGSLEVGKSSTRAVVYCSILILLFNFILTQLLLA